MMLSRCCIFLLCSIVQTAFAPTTAKSTALETEIVSVNIPSVLRSFVSGALPHLRHAEDTYLENIKKIEDDIRHYTRLLEDVISPASTTADGVTVDPIPKVEVDKIQTAARTLQDNMWAVKAFEPTFFANVRAIQNAIRDFSRNVEDKYQQNKHSVEFMLTTSRGFLDIVRRTARFLEDKVKENNRYLEDNLWKFVRSMEDIVQIIEKSPTLYWKDDKELQFGKILKVIYTLKQKLEYNTRVFSQTFQIKVSKIEAVADYGVGTLLDTVDATKKNYIPSEAPQIIGLC